MSVLLIYALALTLVATVIALTGQGRTTGVNSRRGKQAIQAEIKNGRQAIISSLLPRKQGTEHAAAGDAPMNTGAYGGGAATDATPLNQRGELSLRFIHCLIIRPVECSLYISCPFHHNCAGAVHLRSPGADGHRDNAGDGPGTPAMFV